ncbi:uncharacterized protein [Periplaneta americana]|uniref:uncharacterized protein n=1 Tax=Periplaneta americana TaxID=6978 RepID=UPI0037E9590A
MCLAKYNLVFNYHKPSDDNPFFSNNMEGMECFCLPDCSFPQYNTAMSMSKLTEGAEGVEDLTNIFLDVHFQNPAVVRYRTDVAYGWLDLVVAFGGIAGLCLGCSLLSAAELFYYLTIRLYRHYRLVHPKGSSLPTHKNGMQHKTAFFNMKQYGNHKQKTSPRTLQAISPTSLNMAYIPTTNSIRSYR